MLGHTIKKDGIEMGKDLQLNIDIQIAGLIDVDPYSVINKKDITLYKSSATSFKITLYDGSENYTVPTGTGFVFFIGTAITQASPSSTLLANVVENQFSIENVIDAGSIVTFNLVMNTQEIDDAIAGKSILSLTGELWMLEPTEDATLIWQKSMMLKATVGNDLTDVSPIVTYSSELIRTEGNTIILLKPDGSIAQTW